MDSAALEDLSSSDEDHNQPSRRSLSEPEPDSLAGSRVPDSSSLFLWNEQDAFDKVSEAYFQWANYMQETSLEECQMRAAVQNFNCNLLFESLQHWLDRTDSSYKGRNLCSLRQSQMFCLFRAWVSQSTRYFFQHWKDMCGQLFIEEPDLANPVVEILERLEHPEFKKRLLLRCITFTGAMVVVLRSHLFDANPSIVNKFEYGLRKLNIASIKASPPVGARRFRTLSRSNSAAESGIASTPPSGFSTPHESQIFDLSDVDEVEEEDDEEVTIADRRNQRFPFSPALSEAVSAALGSESVLSEHEHGNLPFKQSLLARAREKKLREEAQRARVIEMAHSRQALLKAAEASARANRNSRNPADSGPGSTWGNNRPAPVPAPAPAPGLSSAPASHVAQLLAISGAAVPPSSSAPNEVINTLLAEMKELRKMVADQALHTPVVAAKSSFDTELDELPAPVQGPKIDTSSISNCLNPGCSSIVDPLRYCVDCYCPGSIQNFVCSDPSCKERIAGNSITELMSKVRCPACLNTYIWALTDDLERTKLAQRYLQIAASAQKWEFTFPSSCSTMPAYMKVTEGENSQFKLIRSSNSAGHTIFGRASDSAQQTLELHCMAVASVPDAQVFSRKLPFNVNPKVVLCTLKGCKFGSYSGLTVKPKDSASLRMSMTDLTKVSPHELSKVTKHWTKENVEIESPPFDFNSVDAYLLLEDFFKNMTTWLDEFMSDVFALEHHNLTQHILLAHRLEEIKRVDFTVEQCFLKYSSQWCCFNAQMEGYVSKSSCLHQVHGSDIIMMNEGMSSQRPTLHARSFLQGTTIGAWTVHIDRNFIKPMAQGIKSIAAKAAFEERQKEKAAADKAAKAPAPAPKAPPDKAAADKAAAEKAKADKAKADKLKAAAPAPATTKGYINFINLPDVLTTYHDKNDSCFANGSIPVMPYGLRSDLDNLEWKPQHWMTKTCVRCLCEGHEITKCQATQPDPAARPQAAPRWNLKALLKNLSHHIQSAARPSTYIGTARTSPASPAELGGIPAADRKLAQWIDGAPQALRMAQPQLNDMEATCIIGDRVPIKVSNIFDLNSAQAEIDISITFTALSDVPNHVFKAKAICVGDAILTHSGIQQQRCLFAAVAVEAGVDPTIMFDQMHSDAKLISSMTMDTAFANLAPVAELLLFSEFAKRACDNCIVRSQPVSTFSLKIMWPPCLGTQPLLMASFKDGKMQLALFVLAVSPEIQSNLSDNALHSTAIKNHLYRMEWEVAMVSLFEVLNFLNRARRHADVSIVLCVRAVDTLAGRLPVPPTWMPDWALLLVSDISANTVPTTGGIPNNTPFSSGLLGVCFISSTLLTVIPPLCDVNEVRSVLGESGDPASSSLCDIIDCEIADDSSYSDGSDLRLLDLMTEATMLCQANEVQASVRESMDIALMLRATHRDLSLLLPVGVIQDTLTTWLWSLDLADTFQLRRFAGCMRDIQALSPDYPSCCLNWKNLVIDSNSDTSESSSDGTSYHPALFANLPASWASRFNTWDVDADSARLSVLRQVLDLINYSSTVQGSRVQVPTCVRVLGASGRKQTSYARLSDKSSSDERSPIAARQCDMTQPALNRLVEATSRGIGGPGTGDHDRWLARQLARDQTAPSTNTSTVAPRRSGRIPCPRLRDDEGLPVLVDDDSSSDLSSDEYHAAMCVRIKKDTYLKPVFPFESSNTQGLPHAAKFLSDMCAHREELASQVVSADEAALVEAARQQASGASSTVLQRNEPPPPKLIPLGPVLSNPQDAGLRAWISFCSRFDKPWQLTPASPLEVQAAAAQAELFIMYETATFGSLASIACSKLDSVAQEHLRLGLADPFSSNVVLRALCSRLCNAEVAAREATQAPVSLIRPESNSADEVPAASALGAHSNLSAVQAARLPGYLKLPPSNEILSAAEGRTKQSTICFRPTEAAPHSSAPPEDPADSAAPAESGQDFH